MRTFRLPAVALAALWMAGCGFHLRRAPDLPPAMRKLYIAAPPGNGALLRQLRRQLSSDNTEILETPDNATATLSIIYTRQHSSPLAIGVRGRALEYQVQYEVEFSLIVQGAVLLEPQTITQTHQYAYSVSNAIANEEQEDALARSMIDDISQLISFRVVAAAKNLPADGTAPAPAAATRVLAAGTAVPVPAATPPV